MSKIKKSSFFIFLYFSYFSSVLKGEEYQVILDDALPAYQYGASQNIANEIAIKGKELNLSPRSAVTFTNFGSGDTYYALYSDMQIRKFDLLNKQYLGGWKLGAGALCQEGDPECEQPWWAGRWEEEVLENSARAMAYRWEIVGDAKIGPCGCISIKTLKYADFNQDGIYELVLLNVNNEFADVIDFIVFSTSVHKTIFSSLLYGNDSIDDTNHSAVHCHTQNKPQEPQFWQKSDQYQRCMESAVKAFAKLYFSDFDADGAFDILVWRKLYESRLNADPVKGFIKKSDTFVHYKLVNGEYKKQETDQATIKSWLSAKQLTWQKGYPSKSECPGQEGQLIPEMHDPLLNDPEVLQ